MTRRLFAAYVTGATDEYRLDVVTDPEPDSPQGLAVASGPKTTLPGPAVTGRARTPRRSLDRH